MGTDTDRIEKKVLLRAPRERVWRAISDARQFGSWFGVEFDGPFVAGATTIGKIVPTTVDPEVAKTQKPYEGFKFEFAIDRIEPPAVVFLPLASVRRRAPASITRKSRPRSSPSSWQEAAGGTMLTVTESGFDRIPLERRAKAFAANEQGWAAQLKLIEKYLALAA